MRRLHKSISIAALFLIGFSLFSSFFLASAQPAEAAQEKGVWIDHARLTVDFNGETLTYQDNKTDGRDSETYKRVNSPGCGDKDYVDSFNDGHTNGVLHVSRQRSETNTQCDVKTFTVGFSQSPNYGNYFIWKDAGTIETADNTRVYNKSKKNPERYLQDEGSNSCIDYLVPSTTNQTATLYVGTDISNVNLALFNSNVVVFAQNILNQTNYSDFMSLNAFKNNIGTVKKDGECYVVQVKDLPLGFTNLAAKPEGTGQDTIDGATSASNNTDTDIAESCYKNSTSLGWVVCPLLDLLLQTVDKTKTVVFDLLEVKPLAFDQSSGIFTAWNNFKNIANGLLILVFLLIIFGTTASIGIDNYTVKKALPRLVAAAIFIQFSYVLCSLAVDISNIVGAGMAGLISSGVDVRAGFGNWVGAITGVGGIAVVGGLIASVGPAILFVVGSLVLGILGALLTLIFRQILIMVLIVLAPVAFVAWVLPNTETAFKQWSKNFTKALIMFPLIGVIFGASELFGKIAISDSSNWQQLIGLVALAAPLFAIPWTFKASGSAMAMGSNILHGGLKGAGKSLKSSQAAKDAKQTQKQGRADMAQNSPNKLGKAYGRLGALGAASVLPTRANKRNIAKLSAGHRADLTKSLEGVVNDADLIKGANSNNVEESAANIAELAKRGNYKALYGEEIENADGSITKKDGIFDTAIKSPNSSVAKGFERANQLYKGNFDSMPNVSPAGKRNGTGAEQWRQKTAAEFTDDQITASSRASFRSFVNQVDSGQARRILANPNLTRQLSQEKVKALEDRRDGHAVHMSLVPPVPGTPSTPPATGGGTPPSTGPTDARVGEKFSSVEQVTYDKSGARHVYGVDKDTGKREHISNDDVLESYGYDPKDPADMPPPK